MNNHSNTPPSNNSDGHAYHDEDADDYADDRDEEGQLSPWVSHIDEAAVLEFRNFGRTHGLDEDRLAELTALEESIRDLEERVADCYDLVEVTDPETGETDYVYQLPSSNVARETRLLAELHNKQRELVLIDPDELTLYRRWAVLESMQRYCDARY